MNEATLVEETRIGSVYDSSLGVFLRIWEYPNGKTSKGYVFQKDDSERRYGCTSEDAAVMTGRACLIVVG